MSIIEKLEAKAQYHNQQAQACSHLPVQCAGHEIARDAYYTAIELIHQEAQEAPKANDHF